MQKRNGGFKLATALVIVVALFVNLFSGFNVNVNAQEDILELSEANETTTVSKRMLRYLIPGEGTSSNPYLISTESELKDAWIMGLDKNYKLMDDITLTSEWSPIGSLSTQPFSGNFDGNGKIISNVKVTGGNNVGFFGFLNKANIHNLTLQNVSTKGNSTYIGGLAAYATASTITNCKIINSTIEHVETVTAGHAGGFIGYVDGSSIIADCHVDAANVNGNVVRNSIGGFFGTIYNSNVTNVSLRNAVVTSNQVSTYTGGFVGLISGGTITKAYSIGGRVLSKGSATGSAEYIGGFAGHIDSATINQCFTSGSVSLPKHEAQAGGFAGHIYGGTVSDCFTTCDVTAPFSTVASTYSVGGFVGYQYGCTTSRIYASGVLLGNNVSGLIGATYSITLKDSFALSPKVTTNLAKAYRIVVAPPSIYSLVNNYAFEDGKYFNNIGKEFRDATQEYQNAYSGYSISAADMKRKITYEQKAQWDFDTIWAIDENNGLPYLQFAGDIAGAPIPGIVPPTTAPNKPGILTVNDSNNQLLLTWDKVAEATGYIVYINGTAQPLTTNPKFVVQSDISRGGTFTLAVEAVNAFGNSPKSMEITIKLPSIGGSNVVDPTLNLIGSSYMSNIDHDSGAGIYKINNAFDNDSATVWKAPAGETNSYFDIVFNDQITFNEVFLLESTARIQSYQIMYWDEDTGAYVTFLSGGTLGDNIAKNLATTSDITTKKVRFEFVRKTAGAASVSLREIALTYK
jgi:hypothetical protein